MLWRHEGDWRRCCSSLAPSRWCDVRLCAAPYHALSHPLDAAIRIMTVARALWVQTLLLTFAVWLGAIVRFFGFCLADGIHGTNVSLPRDDGLQNVVEEVRAFMRRRLAMHSRLTTRVS